MLYSAKTYDSQQRLSRWVRTGENADVPGTTAEGLKQYRRLFRNNINNTLTQAYPISLEVLSNEQWNKMVDGFYANHDAQTPHVWKLPFEFYQFARESDYAQKYGFPFLNDLLYFEWLEIDVYTMPNKYPEPFKENGDAMNDLIEVNREYSLERLEYPVHLYAAKESLNHKGNYFLLTYRTPKDFEVKFLDMPPLHVLFFEKISNERLTASQIIDQLLVQNNEIPKEQLAQNILGFIQTMMEEKVFLGFSENYLN